MLDQVQRGLYCRPCRQHNNSWVTLSLRWYTLIRIPKPKDSNHLIHDINALINAGIAPHEAILIHIESQIWYPDYFAGSSPFVCFDPTGGGQLNVDRRFDPILIVESTIIFRNSCRFVDRFFASKTCRL